MFNNNVGSHASCYIFSLKICLLQLSFCCWCCCCWCSLLLMFIFVTSGLQYTCCIFRYHKSVSSVNQLSLTLWGPMDCKMSGFPVHHQLLELSQTHVDQVGEVIQPFHPVIHFFYCLQSMRVFSNESVLHIRWPKYWSFSFSISPSSEYSGLISFRMDWLDLIPVQRTLKSLLQHHSSKASVLQCSSFFIVQLSHPYMTTGKTIALTGRILSAK